MLPTMKKLVFFMVLLAYFATAQGFQCEPCTDPNKWQPWEPWSTCLPLNGDLCNKQQTRSRLYPGVFVCLSCNRQYETRRCGQCDHACNSNNGVCSCNRGYTLGSDGRTCTDVNECNNNNGGCQHKCTNTPGSYSCSCKDGYIVSTSDTKLCTALSCGALTPSCPSNSYKDQAGNACEDVIKTCSNNFLFNSTCALSCPSNYKLATIPNIPGGTIFAEFVKDANFITPVSSAGCVFNKSSTTVHWNLQKNVYQNLYCRRVRDAPRNLNLSKVFLHEHQPEHTVVGTFSVEDDVKDNVVFTIVNTAAANFFYIDRLTLKALVKFNLKHMVADEIPVKVRATNNATLYTEKEFKILVKNINDPPEDIKISNSVFSDLTKVGDIIGNLSAIDYDDKPAMRKTDFVWTLTDDGNGHFSLQGNSIILAKQFDTNVDITKLVVVQCSDKDPLSPKLSTQQIYLSRNNLNNPVSITLNVTSPLKETASIGTVYGKFRIVDSENNTVIVKDQSSVATKEKFTLNGTVCTHETAGTVCTVDIVLIGELDYETTNKYTLMVEAIDSHNETTIRPFYISVENVNEAPYLLQFQDLSEVDEGSSDDTLIAALSVRDVDSQIQLCKVTDIQSPFKMRGLNVVLKTNEVLDFEEKDKYTLEVTCWDDGTPALEISNKTTVYIVDKNELASSPCTTNNIKLNHTTPNGTVVTELRSVDPDNKKLPKQKLNYDLMNAGEVPFKVENNKLIINGPMSPNSVYNVKVKVSDDGVLMKHENGGLMKYKGRIQSKEYFCQVSTNVFFPCKSYHEYKDGRCVCKDQRSGFLCDRSQSRCENSNCPQSCTELIHSPTMCSKTENQLPMLLNVKFSNFLNSEKYRYDLENYIKAILEGKSEGKTLQNLKGSNRARRNTKNTKNDTINYYVEAINPISVRSVYTYVKFIPYDVGNQYNMVDASRLCTLFENTDVRCVNDQDCKILETVGIKCSQTFGKTTGVENPSEVSKESGAPNYAYIVAPVVVAILIIAFIVTLLVRRNRNKKPVKEVPPVVYNNHLNNVSTGANHGDQTMTDIERLQQVTDIEVFDNQVFKRNDGATVNEFEFQNPSYGINKINPEDVNFRVNNVFIEDKGTEKTLNLPETNSPLYASIGKAAKNPLYQTSTKRAEPNAYESMVAGTDGTKVELTPEEKAAGKEYALVDELPDLREVRRGQSLNEYNPKEDNEKDKNFKKNNLDDK